MGCGSSKSTSVVPFTADQKDADALSITSSLSQDEQAKDDDPSAEEWGAINVQLLYDVKRVQLIVRVKSAAGVKAMDLNGKSDPYVVLKFYPNAKKQKLKVFRTKIQKTTLKPVWDETFVWKLTTLADLKDERIQLCVWDHDRISADDFMGRTSIPISQVPTDGTAFGGWFQLFDRKVGRTTFNILSCDPTSVRERYGIEMPLKEDEEGDELDDELARTGSTLSLNKDKDSAVKQQAFKNDRKEREEVLRMAQELGDARRASGEKPRHLTILYNPVSGSGTAKKIVDRLVTPVLRNANVEYDVIPTQYAGYAREYMRDLDIKKTNGVLIAGGDGLVSEVITGYYNRADNGGGLPVGIIPSGTANAMAHDLHTQTSHSQSSVVSNAALQAAKGSTRRVDVLKITGEGDDDVYALSVMGWGLAGAVALKAAKLRWIPGQKNVRYDLAGFVTMVRDWPVIDKARMHFLMDVEKDGKPALEWVEEDVSLVNMVVTNLSKLGVDHPITQDMEPDNGRFCVLVCDGSASRMDVVNLAVTMKKGKFLEEGRICRTYKVKEVKIFPDKQWKSTTPFLVDGDPKIASDIHVINMHQALPVFASPPLASSTSSKGGPVKGGLKGGPKGGKNTHAASGAKAGNSNSNGKKNESEAAETIQKAWRKHSAGKR